ncbi:MAG: cohesin domain-containing protein [Candidatus Paceibacterota bacterium]
MHILKFLRIGLIAFVISAIFYGNSVYAQINDSKGAVFDFSPKTETVIAGSTFEVAVILDTRGSSVNAVELNIKFPVDKLEMISPSTGKSFISLWSEPPSYSNVNGTAKFAGGVPNGIVTESGLIITLTFKAKATGQAIIEVTPESKALANDGLGTNILSARGRGTFTITPKPPEGVRVFSDTHSFQDKWYNNNNPIISWEKPDGVEDFSYELDDRPFTIPDNNPETTGTVKAYQDVSDGIKYFHVKARKEGMWGSTTHFMIHIDTTPPAEFTPKVEILTAAVIQRALISFFTTDALSGIDHYEVGVIDKEKAPTESPAFIEVQSPYQISSFSANSSRVIVRAIDRAGNVRDESTDVNVSSSQLFYLLLIGAFILILLILCYIFVRKMLAKRRARKIENNKEYRNERVETRSSSEVPVWKVDYPEPTAEKPFPFERNNNDSKNKKPALEIYEKEKIIRTPPEVIYPEPVPRTPPSPAPKISTPVTPTSQPVEPSPLPTSASIPTTPFPQPTPTPVVTPSPVTAPPISNPVTPTPPSKPIAQPVFSSQIYYPSKYVPKDTQNSPLKTTPNTVVESSSVKTPEAQNLDVKKVIVNTIVDDHPTLPEQKNRMDFLGPDPR